MDRVTRCPLAVVLLLLLCGLLSAQSDSGTRSVEGHVLDRTGHILRGAIVQIKDVKSLQIRSFITQENGAYHFFGLSTNSDYEISAAKDGEESKAKSLSSFDSKIKVVIDLRLNVKIRD